MKPDLTRYAQSSDLWAAILWPVALILWIVYASIEIWIELQLIGRF